MLMLLKSGFVPRCECSAGHSDHARVEAYSAGLSATRVSKVEVKLPSRRLCIASSATLTAQATPTRRSHSTRG